ncbi:type III restriction enzyme [Phlyctema vagabunda]|uniref:ATP-dependent DNA helicase n=1 Tax=Phlyctema vagabunda TaxID=108571 RepID=A0ABR4P3J2_9HELO
MSISDEEDYGDIADEDLIEFESQASQQLPPHPPPSKKRRTTPLPDNDEISEDELRSTGRRRSSTSAEATRGDDVDEDGQRKKSKYKIHIHENAREVPAAVIVGATQAEQLPDSSPSRIRGPIYKRPRAEPPRASIFSGTSRRQVPASNPVVRVTSNLTPRPAPKPFQRTISGISEEDCARELEDLPSDAFMSSPEFESQPAVRRTTFGSSFSTQGNTATQTTPRQRLAAPQNGLRQTTLFGGRASQIEVPASQVNKVHNYRVDLPPEAPTHHAMDHEALKTWVYPTNLGEIRDYQYSIVKNGLFNNLLVALPTGLGKTFIAATIMFNFFRWFKDAKIVFVAPTKPLVAQQVEACFQTVAIPRSTTAMLTGGIQRALRADEWAEKRVFFMTPQTLDNDLKYGYADPKKIVLLVVDEAHRATGNYAYVNIVKFMRKFNPSFRVLALTATPGGTVEAVQEVIDGLEISKVEIRTEESIDIQQFVHQRNIDQIVLDPSDEIIMVKELYSKALQPLVTKLCGLNAYYNKDPMALTPFGLIQAKSNWAKSPAGKNANQAVKWMAHGLFTVLAGLAHGIKVLNFHGIGPFYANVKELRHGVESKEAGGKYRSQVVDSADFKKMMTTIQTWLNKDDFVGHPKMTYLCDTILNHFLDAGEGRLGDNAPPSSTRVIVFAEYRDSAEDISRVLNRHQPMIRSSVFVGQADSKRSAGMNQEAQQEVIRKFKTGTFNVIVATSIGEEGLDIGQVDLIVCYDASASPIRMLQRMGRTGRKRAGNIVLLLMRGKEEDSFMKAKDNYEQMQKMISSGKRFNFRHDLSTRIIPRDVKPVVEKRIIDIPVENTQDKSLPEPTKRGRKAAAKKAPAKKFHMPDGVETGFTMASHLSGDGVPLTNMGITRKVSKAAQPQLVSIPPLESVLLSADQNNEFQKTYLMVAGNDIQEVGMPDVTVQTLAQRSLSHTVSVKHGSHTKRCVQLFRTLSTCETAATYDMSRYEEEMSDLSWIAPPALVEDDQELKRLPKSKKSAPKTSKPVPKTAKSTAKASNPPSRAAKPTSKPKRNPMPFAEDASEDEGDEDSDVPRQTGEINSDIEGESVGDSDTGGDLESEDEDEGSLRDFISHGPSSMNKISSQFSASSPIVQERPKLFFEPTQFTATQDTNDDDIPDLGQLFSSTVKGKQPIVDADSDEDDTPCTILPPAKLNAKRHISSSVEEETANITAAKARGKRRRIVEDEDSDE